MYYVSIRLIEETNGLDTSSVNMKRLESKLSSAKDCKDMKFSNHEKSIISGIVYPEDIQCSFENIGGHSDIKDSLTKYLFNPLQRKSKKDEPLFAPPNGIILHGVPGTGKTMFAKAIAKKIDGLFVSCSPSMFENKLYGESSKLIKALFTFANKVQPCVIFIDEMDGILGTRNDFDQSLVNEVKTIFLQEMDGVLERNPNVVFIGATNKLCSIDKAIKRRMRLHIEVPLPDIESRKSILELHLAKYNIDLENILKDTDGFSGSDLFEMCKLAGLEAISEKRDTITLDDLNTALKQLSQC
jgi:ATP-dependent 26S proteasome regulatory subunit